MDCTNFSKTSLMQADFGPAQNFPDDPQCRTNFTEATLDVAAIDTSNWGVSDFTRANFQNLSPSTFNLIGKDTTGAVLAQTGFEHIDMTGEIGREQGRERVWK